MNKRAVPFKRNHECKPGCNSVKHTSSHPYHYAHSKCESAPGRGRVAAARVTGQGRPPTTTKAKLSRKGASQQKTLT